MSLNHEQISTLLGIFLQTDLHVECEKAEPDIDWEAASRFLAFNEICDNNNGWLCIQPGYQCSDLSFVKIHLTQLYMNRRRMYVVHNFIYQSPVTFYKTGK